MSTLRPKAIVPVWTNGSVPTIIRSSAGCITLSQKPFLSVNRPLSRKMAQPVQLQYFDNLIFPARLRKPPGRPPGTRVTVIG